MCQVHTGAYVSLLTPGETVYTDCHRRKTTPYILHVVPITTDTHDRRKSIGEQKQRREEKYKGKEIKEKKAKQSGKGKKRKRQEEQEKTRQEEEARKGKKKKIIKKNEEKCHTSRS